MNCSGHGQCRFVQIATDAELGSCTLDDPSCEAGCFCADDYSGSGCELSLDDLQSRRAVRSQLIDSLSNLTALDDINDQSVADWSANLYSLSLNPYDLSVVDTAKVVDIANVTISSAIELSVEAFDSMIGVLQATDTVTSVRKYNYNPVDYRSIGSSSGNSSADSSSYEFRNNTAEDIIRVVGLFGDLVTGAKVLGESSTIYVYDNFRVSAGLDSLAPPTSDTDSNLTVSNPQTASAELVGLPASTTTLVPLPDSETSTTLAIKVISVYPRSYTQDPSGFISEPTYLQFTAAGGSNDVAVEQLLSKMVFTFQHISPRTDYSNTEVYNVTSTCVGSAANESYSHVCPITGHVIEHNCSNGPGVYTSYCPVPRPACASLDIVSAQVDIVASCNVLDYSEAFTTCECTLSNLTSNSSASVGSAADASSASFSLSSLDRRQLREEAEATQVALDRTGVSSMVATSTLIALQFADTFKRAENFNSAEDLANVLVVLIMFCTLWGAGILLVTSCFFKDTDFVRKKWENMRNNMKKSPQSNMNEVNDKGDGQVLSVGLDESDNEVMGTSARQHQNPSATVLGAKQRLLDYIELIIPRVFAENKPTWARMFSELSAHHRFLSLMTTTDAEMSTFEKIIIVMKFLTVETTEMFLLAVFFDLEGPADDGTCPLLVSEFDCLERKSILDDSRTYCLWAFTDDPSLPQGGNFQCIYNEDTFTMKAFLYMVILTSIFTAILDTPMEYAFKICSAPLLRDAALEQTTTSSTYDQLSQAAAQVAGRARRMSNAAVVTAVAARRRSAVAIDATQQYVRERLAATVEAAKKTVIADRQIPDSVKEVHNLAMQLLPTVAPRLTEVRQHRSQSAVRMKSMAVARRSQRYSRASSTSRGTGTGASTSSLLFFQEMRSLQQEDEVRAASAVNQPAEPAETRTDPPDNGFGSDENVSDAANAVMIASASVSSAVRAQADSLCEEVLSQRMFLPPTAASTAVFDDQWGIIPSNTPPAATDKNNVDPVVAGVGEGELTIRKEALAAICLDVAESEREAMVLKEKLPFYTVHHAGLAILHSFLLDVLGRRTTAAQIFGNKFEEDFQQSKAVSIWQKSAAIGAIIGLNAFFVYFALLRADEKGRTWQYQYLAACIVQSVIEICLNETLECVWLHVAVPNLVKKEVSRAMSVLNGIIDQVSIAAQQKHSPSKYTANRQIFLDATSYLFTSTKVAQAFPNFLESLLVLSYHTHIPGELSRTWPHYRQRLLAEEHNHSNGQQDATGPDEVGGNSNSGDGNPDGGRTSWLHSRYNPVVQLVRLFVAFTALALVILQWMGALSFGYQRVIIRFVQPLVLSGITLVIFFATTSTAALTVVVVFGVLVISYFAWHYYRYQKRVQRQQELLKIQPVDMPLSLEEGENEEDSSSIGSSEINISEDSFQRKEKEDRQDSEDESLASIVFDDDDDDDDDDICSLDTFDDGDNDDMGDMHLPIPIRKRVSSTTTADAPGSSSFSAPRRSSSVSSNSSASRPPRPAAAASSTAAASEIVTISAASAKWYSVDSFDLPSPPSSSGGDGSTSTGSGNGSGDGEGNEQDADSVFEQPSPPSSSGEEEDEKEEEEEEEEEGNYANSLYVKHKLERKQFLENQHLQQQEREQSRQAQLQESLLAQQRRQLQERDEVQQKLLLQQQEQEQASRFRDQYFQQLEQRQQEHKEQHAAVTLERTMRSKLVQEQEAEQRRQWLEEQHALQKKREEERREEQQKVHSSQKLNHIDSHASELEERMRRVQEQEAEQRRQWLEEQHALQKKREEERREEQQKVHSSQKLNHIDSHASELEERMRRVQEQEAEQRRQWLEEQHALQKKREEERREEQQKRHIQHVERDQEYFSPVNSSSARFTPSADSSTKLTIHAPDPLATMNESGELVGEHSQRTRDDTSSDEGSISSSDEDNGTSDSSESWQT